jgi:ribonuclease HI
MAIPPLPYAATHAAGWRSPGLLREGMSCRGYTQSNMQPLSGFPLRWDSTKYCTYPWSMTSPGPFRVGRKSELYSWTLDPFNTTLAFCAPGFDYTHYNVGTKSSTSPDLYLSLVSENYEGYDKIFTVVLKQGICVAAAAVSHDKVLVKRLPNHASILWAKAIAILLALDIISQSTKHFIILSDSLSCVNAVENRNLENPLVVENLERVHQQLQLDQRITFVWVPSHIGIAGNMGVDAVAKAGVNLPISNAETPHRVQTTHIESREKSLATVLEFIY